MNVSTVLTRDYRNDYDFRPGKTNPPLISFEGPMVEQIDGRAVEFDFAAVKDRNILISDTTFRDGQQARPLGRRKNKAKQTQSNPKQTQFQTRRTGPR